MKRTTKATDEGIFVYMDDKPISKKEKKLIAELIVKDKAELRSKALITKTKAQS